MTVVLVVDDVAAMVEQYAYDLERLGGYDTLTASSGREALDVLRRKVVDCVILDLEMPGMDGFDVLRTLDDEKIDVPVIVYTGTGSYDRCVLAVRLGAYGFIDKDEPVERVVHEVENALKRRDLEADVRSLEERIEGETPLVGGSAPMRALDETLNRVAPIPSPALVLGESGTGKELVARELHRRSPRADHRFLAVSCAALPESLVESELFGHERGAFTGADRTRKGAFEAAGEGTLFLDEVGELPAEAQAKLLRVLQEGEITRVGSHESIPVPARVVAATNRDLEEEVREGRFREDLLFRLNVHTIRVPPLRDRLSDIPALVDHFLTELTPRLGMERKPLTDAVLDRLMAYDWARNNVRELRNIVERMIIADDDGLLDEDDIPPAIRSAATTGTVGPGKSRGDGGSLGFKDRKAEAERRIIVSALERNDWHITRTAAELELADHASLLKIMRRLGIERADQG